MIDYNEPALLSVLISDNNLMESVLYLKQDDFEDSFHGMIFEAIKKINAEGNKADIITIAEELKSVARGEIYSRLYDVINSPRAIENLSHYANNILEKSKKRKFVLIMRNALYRLDKETDSIDTIAEMILSELTAMESVHNIEVKPFGHLSEKFFELLDKRMTAKDGLAGISTGFKNLDEVTSGFIGGQLIVLGARPGNGKTTLASNIAMTHVNSGGVVAFFSLEMPDISMYERFMSSESGVNAKKIKNGEIDQESLTQLLKTSSDFKEKKMFLLDAQSTQDITRISRQLKKQGLSMIVVDYLGLLLIGKHEHAHLALGEITRILKKLAIQLDVPILLLSQLNRNIENRPDAIPKLSDLRQSGSIEQDADIVMFLSQCDKDKPSSPLHGYGILDIAKHRDGNLETLILGFEGHRNRFVETTMTYARFEELKNRKKTTSELSTYNNFPPIDVWKD